MISATCFPAQAGSQANSSTAARKNPYNLGNPTEYMMTLPQLLSYHENLPIRSRLTNLVSQITHRDFDRQITEPHTISIRRPACGSPFAVRDFRFRMAQKIRGRC